MQVSHKVRPCYADPHGPATGQSVTPANKSLTPLQPPKWMNRREQEKMKIMADTNPVAHIRAYLLGSGHRFTGESAEFEAVIRALYSEGRQVSNQAIILRLKDEQAAATDKNRQATLLSLQQLVAGYTPDDPHT